MAKTYDYEAARKERIANRQCIQCGSALPDGWTIQRCPRCRQMNSDNLKERRERCKALGLCYECLAPARPGKTLCFKCAFGKRDYYAERYAKIKSAK